MKSCIVGHWIPSLRRVRRCQVHPGRSGRRRAALHLDAPQVLPLVAGVQLVEVLENSPLDGFLWDYKKMIYEREIDLWLRVPSLATCNEMMDESEGL